MWIVLALSGVTISIIGMLLIAWKWNIPGRSILLSAVIVALVASLPFFWVYFHYKSGWQIIIGIIVQIGLTISIALGLVLLHFSRDPERYPPQEKGVIISPADGEVIYVNVIPTGSTPVVTKNNCDYCLHELTGTEIADNPMVIIGIEMNILNVHVNRCPIEGHVELVKHITGKFISLRNEEAPFINARCTTVVINEALTVAIVQIASRLVRRVDNYLQLGQFVRSGQRLGMIRFGSQVAAIFPNREDIKIEVHIGQKVFAGTSILARYMEKVEMESSPEERV
jgi:phosphatidylserine decarboxylase